MDLVFLIELFSIGKRKTEQSNSYIFNEYHKGRTIRKVMGGGGGGEFSARTIVFFRPLLVQEFYLQVKPSARFFFFRQILLCLSFTN